MLLSVMDMYPGPAGWIAWNPCYGFRLGVDDFLDVRTVGEVFLGPVTVGVSARGMWTVISLISRA